MRVIILRDAPASHVVHWAEHCEEDASNAGLVRQEVSEASYICFVIAEVAGKTVLTFLRRRMSSANVPIALHTCNVHIRTFRGIM
jgi:hypothetical protein